MEVGTSRRLSAQERLTQLENVQTLYDAGLFRSALLMTGIHISTVRKDEQWFHCRALSHYARCLSQLKEHRRALEYYRKASSLMSSPLPPELLTGPTSSDNVTSGSNRQPGDTTLPSAGVERLTEAKLDSKTLASEKQARDQTRKELGKLASQMEIMTRQAKANAVAARASALGKTTEGSLTSSSAQFIPPVILQSNSLKHTFSSSSSSSSSSLSTMRHHDEDPPRKRRDISRIPSPSPDRLSGETVSGSTVGGPNSMATSLAALDSLKLRVDYARSCIEYEDFKTAGQVLGAIPEEKRTAEVYFMLIKLYQKKVIFVRLHPFAIEASAQRLRHSVPLAQVLNLLPSTSIEKHWMRSYLQGMDHMIRKKFQAALSEFETLNERYPRNIDIKLRIACCLRLMGKFARSCLIFSEIRKLDSGVTEEMYHYGMALKSLWKTSNLNLLARDLLIINDKHPDAWCVQALYWEIQGNMKTAMHAITRALELDSNHCGAMGIFGRFQIDTLPLVALKYLRSAYNLERNIDTCADLVTAYIRLDRKKEALGIAKEAKALMPDNAQAIALYGIAVSYSPDHDIKDAENAYLDALSMNPVCEGAVSGLVSIYQNQRRFNDAIDILERQLDYQPSDDLFIKRAEIFRALENWESALLSYQDALLMNPGNMAATNGSKEVMKVINNDDDEEEEEEEEDIDAEEVDEDQYPEDMEGDADHQQELHLDGHEEEYLAAEEAHGDGEQYPLVYQTRHSPRRSVFTPQYARRPSGQHQLGGQHDRSRGAAQRLQHQQQQSMMATPQPRRGLQRPAAGQEHPGTGTYRLQYGSYADGEQGSEE
ncbi:Anaphase-promoting complex subunit 7 [Lunasporangiospora selenospora]|uniref:Anaphase-promoting complex subunit 7 n=1 Tax=Lunasporangiospora selenospora TaxID=979761 RepID=A0A9P6FZA5_9FUNG|nr:Anaphase-promoting complex subunit 7 [Lunasporangiospora selenospora]